MLMEKLRTVRPSPTAFIHWRNSFEGIGSRAVAARQASRTGVSFSPISDRLSPKSFSQRHKILSTPPSATLSKTPGVPTPGGPWETSPFERSSSGRSSAMHFDTTSLCCRGRATHAGPASPWRTKLSASWLRPSNCPSLASGPRLFSSRVSSAAKLGAFGGFSFTGARPGRADPVVVFREEDLRDPGPTPPRHPRSARQGLPLPPHALHVFRAVEPVHEELRVALAGALGLVLQDRPHARDERGARPVVERAAVAHVQAELLARLFHHQRPPVPPLRQARGGLRERQPPLQGARPPPPPPPPPPPARPPAPPAACPPPARPPPREPSPRPFP